MIKPSGPKYRGGDFETSLSLVSSEQLVVDAAFDGLTVQVNIFVADTYNRIRLIGVFGGLETVAVVKESEIALEKSVSEPGEDKAAHRLCH